jgi:predicted nucleic acid-binding protein
MIVTDANVIAQLVLPSDNQSLIIHLYEKEKDWLAPILWRSEFRNVLKKYLRANIIDHSLAQHAMAKILETIGKNEFVIDSYKVIQLLTESTISAYDAEYVALAQETGCRLVTFDKKLISLFPDVAVHPDDFLSSTNS